ncbi:hypothetical protein [Mycoplasmopsis cricetuli]|uniref:hypothetical protein n=1 Tax=Mycoplasmopsis cricetuli TaxID=171283 RepID=UPI00046FF3D2|nr:hypothetical protein [Mycoplasmopsis cricetuli]
MKETKEIVELYTRKRKAFILNDHTRKELIKKLSMWIYVSRFSNKKTTEQDLQELKVEAPIVHVIPQVQDTPQMAAMNQTNSTAVMMQPTPVEQVITSTVAVSTKKSKIWRIIYITLIIIFIIICAIAIAYICDFFIFKDTHQDGRLWTSAQRYHGIFGFYFKK